MITNEQNKTVCGCFVCSLKLAAKGGLRAGTSLFCPIYSFSLSADELNQHARLPSRLTVSGYYYYYYYYYY